MSDPIRSRFEVLDERFAFFHGDAWLERLHTGCRWTEGPAWFPAGRYLIFSDIPNDRTLRWDETTGQSGCGAPPPATRTAARWTGRAGCCRASRAAGR